MAQFENSKSLDNYTEDQICIEVNHVTKDYGKGRGIFDISFKIPRGKTFGYCGTNGAGKTTTIRHIMGFLKPDKGYVKVNGLESWTHSAEIKKWIGYLPGEIAFPQVNTGSDFLKSQAELVGLKDMSTAEKVINLMQLDPTANLKRMSKGMKQKTALVVAFMTNPEILILDEPTTGLDPLMRDAFVNLIKEEKAKGTTIIMSNHMFDELEETCDYVGFIKDGHLIDIVDMEKIFNRPTREFRIGFNNEKDFEEFTPPKFIEVISKSEESKYIIVKINVEDTNKLLVLLKDLNLKFVSEIQYTLEKYFLEEVVGEK